MITFGQLQNVSKNLNCNESEKSIFIEAERIERKDGKNQFSDNATSLPLALTLAK